MTRAEFWQKAFLSQVFQCDDVAERELMMKIAPFVAGWALSVYDQKFFQETLSDGSIVVVDKDTLDLVEHRLKNKCNECEKIKILQERLRSLRV